MLQRLNTKRTFSGVSFFVRRMCGALNNGLASLCFHYAADAILVMRISLCSRFGRGNKKVAMTRLFAYSRMKIVEIYVMSEDENNTEVVAYLCGHFPPLSTKHFYAFSLRLACRPSALNIV